MKRFLAFPRDIAFLLSQFPSHLVFFVTSQCNLSCKHCFYFQNIRSYNKSKELSIDEIDKFATTYKSITYVTLTGGEPSLRKDLPQICQILGKKNKVAYFSYHTNGYNTDSILEQLETISLKCSGSFIRVSFSLDGPPEIHDKIRGKSGVFDKCVETIVKVKALKSGIQNIDLDVACVCSKENERYLDWLIDFVERKLKVRLQFINLRGVIRDSDYSPLLTERFEEAVTRLHCNRNSDIKDQYKYSIFKEAIDNIVPKMVTKISKSNRMWPPCQAGRKTIVLDEIGNVKICELLSKSIGNIRDYDFDLIKMLKQHKSEIKENTKKCNCTWECIIPLNILFCLQVYPVFIKEIIKVSLSRKYNYLRTNSKI